MPRKRCQKMRQIERANSGKSIRSELYRNFKEEETMWSYLLDVEKMGVLCCSFIGGEKKKWQQQHPCKQMD